ncbi:TadE family protein [Collinsella sp. AF20-14LB]|uniref:TadE family protein n=1 Tax=Collinsella sp. AF20-14LB TaxID=2292221 RepID=UPI000E537D11|nr:TadE family protein [Collinsella sp. AF20-14LB]RGS91017.1 pilus assembly protein [Collinsella sp. AF20-14LB]
MKRFPNCHRCGGQSLVEFVLCAPLLIIMLFALLDGSAYYRSAMCVRTAATEAATFYTKQPDASDADVKAHVLACVKGTEGIEFSFSAEDAGTTESDYTMRVKQSSGWKIADVKTVTKSKAFTCKKTIKTFLPSLFGEGNTATATATVVGSSSEEGVLR